MLVNIVDNNQSLNAKILRMLATLFEKIKGIEKAEIQNSKLLLVLTIFKLSMPTNPYYKQTKKYQTQKK